MECVFCIYRMGFDSRIVHFLLLAGYVDLVFVLQVLDAPALQDDFYLNLVDWSAQNVLAVGLGTCVYLWSACTSKVLTFGTCGVLLSLHARSVFVCKTVYTFVQYT